MHCRWIVILVLVCSASAAAQQSPLAPGAQTPPLLPEPTVSALAQELSGESAKRNLEFLARLHRQRGSRAFHEAAEFIVAQARAYGLHDAHILPFPADGKIYYGTQRSRPAWDADFAELWELAAHGGAWIPARRLADFEAMPVTLAEDSESADVTADLVDVGNGAREEDYSGKDVRGKLVLISAQPEEAEAIAVEKYGAVGIVSYAQNQRTAWWGEDENLVRWGHLRSFPNVPTFAFMVSLKEARELRERLAKGEQVRLHAVVRAGRHRGFYEVATATIPGADPMLRAQEIIFSCHLDHERPGANDNASGCVAILEVARTLQKLITDGRIPPPARTIRFVWPAEVEGTLALLNGEPELVPHIRAVVHMDMVGGGPVTKAVFHVTRTPDSLPSFSNDVAEAFGAFANQESDAYASTGEADYPLVASEGGKEALLAEFAEWSPGSDHDVYEDGSYRIPAIYLNDWPDRYIHTNSDSPANIDPTKLKRAAFVGGASGYFLANFTGADVNLVWQQVQSGALRRAAATLERRNALLAAGQTREAENLVRQALAFESDDYQSLLNFVANPGASPPDAAGFYAALAKLLGPAAAAPPATGDAALVFHRNPLVRGPLAVFGYDYFADHCASAPSRLLHFAGLRASGDEYAYEVLNFVDGRRNAQEIRDSVSAEFGPVPLDLVLEYLHALASCGVLAPGAAR